MRLYNGATITAQLSSAYTTTAPTYVSNIVNKSVPVVISGTLSASSTTVASGVLTEGGTVLDELNIYNADSVAATITLNYVFGGVTTPIAVVTLSSGDVLRWEGQILKTLDSGGRQKTSAQLPAGNVIFSGYLIEPSLAGITAHASGGQSSATQLSNEVNQIATVATAGDSVKLPPSIAGLTIMVINNGSKPAQVYGSGTDTINGVATSTGVSQMPNSVAFYVCPVAGTWYCEGQGTGYSGSLPTNSFVDGVTASTTHTQAGGVSIGSVITRVTTASSNDALTLPVSAGGLVLTVINASSSTIAIYPNAGGTGSETINALAANAAYTLATTKVVQFICTVPGQWHTLLSA